MGLITNFLKTIGEVFTHPPYATPCNSDCNQGRSCNCDTNLEAQLKHQRDDEFNNANWPFPVGPRP